MIRQGASHVYVAVNNVIFPLFLGMVMYAQNYAN